MKARMILLLMLVMRAKGYLGDNAILLDTPVRA
jgi:hypothetical protein